MLPASVRLRKSDDFDRIVRAGHRAGRPTLVVHALSATEVRPGPPVARSGPGGAGTQVGFVVGRDVGGSVQRHRVARRLRHLMRARWADLPAGAGVVVRALPLAAAASTGTLGRDLDAALNRAGARIARSSAGRAPRRPAGQVSTGVEPGGS